MGTSAGPSLQGIGRGGASNLVLEMDAHDAKSYPGEPTENLYGIVGQYAQNNGNHTGTMVTGQPVNFPVPLAPPLYSYYKIVATGAWSSESNRCLQWAGTSNFAVSTSYHMSFWARTDNPGSTFMYSFYSGGGGRNYGTLTGEWQFFSCQSTTQATYLPLEIVSTESGGQTYYVAAIQVEDKTYATPYVQYGARPASVNLMIHGNVGTGTSFSDSSPSGHTITTVGDTTHSAAQSKFGGDSVYFDGTGDSLTATSADFAFGTGEFTIDCWLYKTATTQHETLFDTYSAGGTNGFLCGLWDTGGTMAFYSENGIGWITATGSTAVALNTWTHLAWLRDGNTLRMFLNGVQQQTATFGADNLDSSALIIGSRASSEYMTGYMDEIRITKGTALWTSAFTPPTRRNLSAPVVDRSGNDNGGNFATKETTDVATYRDGEVIEPIDSAAWDFDGTDDQIRIGSSSSYNNTLDKTVAMWINAGSGVGGLFSAICTNRLGGDAEVNLSVYLDDRKVVRTWNPSGTDEMVLFYSVGNGTSGFYTWSKEKLGTTTGDNLWHYVVGITDVSQNKIFLYYDGYNVHSTTISGTIDTPSADLRLGSGYGPTDSTSPFTGKISAFRVYNKRLTDQQVVENFNQQRNRFNI